MNVTIDRDKQDEEGIRLFVGQTTIITIWDAQSPEAEEFFAEKIAEFLKAEEGQE